MAGDVERTLKALAEAHVDYVVVGGVAVVLHGQIPALAPAPVEGLAPPLASPASPASAQTFGPAPVLPSPGRPPDDGAWTTGFWVAAGVGGALAVTGLAFAIDQQVVAAQLDERCGGEARDACPPTYDFPGARAREERGQAFAIGFGASGLVGLGAAALIYALTPVGDEEAAFVPLVGPTHAGLRLRWCGFWVGPAAGSTAAQRSAGGQVLPLSSKQLQLVVREPYRPFDEPQMMTRLLVEEGQEVVVRSKARNMRLYIDGPERVAKVSLGDVLSFTQGREPLRLLGLASRRRSWGRDRLVDDG